MCLIFSIKWQVHVETDAVKHPVMNLTFFLFFWFDNIFTIREIIFNLAKVTFLFFPCTNKSRNVISLCLTFLFPLNWLDLCKYLFGLSKENKHCFLHCCTVFLHFYVDVGGSVI